jgi:hypothetical protein
MRTPAEYRKEAEGYVRQAEAIPDSHCRTRLLSMAQSCLRLADQAEWLQFNSPAPNGSTSSNWTKFDARDTPSPYSGL